MLLKFALILVRNDKKYVLKIFLSLPVLLTTQEVKENLPTVSQWHQFEMFLRLLWAPANRYGNFMQSCWQKAEELCIKIRRYLELYRPTRYVHMS